MAEYIERNDLEFPYMTMSMWGLNQKTCHAYNEGVKAAEDYIAAIPAADVAPVVRTCDGCLYEKHCPSHEKCHGCARMYHDNYCPNCGAHTKDGE